MVFSSYYCTIIYISDPYSIKTLTRHLLHINTLSFMINWVICKGNCNVIDSTTSVLPFVYRSQWRYSYFEPLKIIKTKTHVHLNSVTLNAIEINRFNQKCKENFGFLFWNRTCFFLWKKMKIFLFFKIPGLRSWIILKD